MTDDNWAKTKKYVSILCEVLPTHSQTSLVAADG